MQREKKKKMKEKKKKGKKEKRKEGGNGYKNQVVLGKRTVEKSVVVFGSLKKIITLKKFFY